MKSTYILIADAHRARCFEQADGDYALVELMSFVSPHIQLNHASGQGNLTGAAGKGHGRTGHAGTQFEPHVEVADKERTQFARELAGYLNTAVNEHRCDKLAVIAPSPMLADITLLLNTAAARSLRRTVAKDFTHYTGSELIQRVKHALTALD